MPAATPRLHRRGAPAETRARLVAAAADVFNRDGYFGTDSNRLARAAGYAPGTYYKHFPDKRSIFLDAYAQWVSVEWQAVGDALRQGGPPPDVARRVVDKILQFHRRWRTLRASLRALVATDSEVRAFYRTQRRRQLDLMGGLRPKRRGTRARVDDAILLFTLERVCDALADGELRDLGLSARAATTVLCELVRRHITASA